MTIKLDHIHISVANLAASVDWYSMIFGFKLVESGVTPQGIRWGIIAFNDSMICMTEYAERGSADRFESPVRHHRIAHFGIRVSDVEAWQDVVKANRLKVYYGGAVGYPSSLSWYIHDPSGHEIEVSYASQGRLEFPMGDVK